MKVTNIWLQGTLIKGPNGKTLRDRCLKVPCDLVQGCIVTPWGVVLPPSRWSGAEVYVEDEPSTEETGAEEDTAKAERESKPGPKPAPVPTTKRRRTRPK